VYVAFLVIKVIRGGCWHLEGRGLVVLKILQCTGPSQEGRAFPNCHSDPTEKRLVATNKTQFLAEINIKFCIFGEAINCIRTG